MPHAPGVFCVGYETYYISFTKADSPCRNQRIGNRPSELDDVDRGLEG